MRKWRPSFRCIYVIPEILGNMQSLEVILNRILPLRIFKNQEDMLVMLGDYMGGDESDKVIDCLINIKEEYKDRVVFLRGCQEEMMLAAEKSDHYFNHWTENGGISTISSYVKRARLNTTAHAIKGNRLKDIIPAKHIDFINNLDYYHIMDEYCFFHGGFNPAKPISENSLGNFVYDFTSSKYLKDSLKNKKDPSFQDNYIFIAHHNYMSDKPFIHPRYFMLGGSAPRKLVVFELNSMSACAVSHGKSRIYKYKFDYHE